MPNLQKTKITLDDRFDFICLILFWNILQRGRVSHDHKTQQLCLNLVLWFSKLVFCNTFWFIVKQPFRLVSRQWCSTVQQLCVADVDDDVVYFCSRAPSTQWMGSTSLLRPLLKTTPRCQRRPQHPQVPNICLPCLSLNYQTCSPQPRSRALGGVSWDQICLFVYKTHSRRVSFLDIFTNVAQVWVWALQTHYIPHTVGYSFMSSGSVWVPWLFWHQ